jgi:Holliday junction resolvasome RuvABC endonuclease subunit
MKILDINKRLEEIKEELPKALKQAWDTESAYNKVYYQVLIHSPLGTAEKREAEAKLVAEQENVLNPYQEARIELRSLLHEKECLIEISRNMRTMHGDE